MQPKKIRSQKPKGQGKSTRQSAKSKSTPSKRSNSKSTRRPVPQSTASTPSDPVVSADPPEVLRTNYPAVNRKSLDLDLPPIYNLKDIFDDICRKAVNLGFENVLRHLGSRKLRVVTMCSGTESPLLALEMISDGALDCISLFVDIILIIAGLKRLHGLAFDIEHLFSAEIVPFKQAYIERNFHPPYIFRDVRELKDGEA